MVGSRRSSRQGAVDLLRAQFHAAWARTDALFGILHESEISAQPIVWRHPFIFYVGHLPAFSWNQICGALLEWPSFNPYFDEVFCRGVDPDVDTGECHWHPDVPEEWPDLESTIEYRDKVRGAMLESVEILSSDRLARGMAAGERVFQMVLEHEYMHQETLLYMIQQLPLEKKKPPKSAVAYRYDQAPGTRPIRVPAGKARLGARYDDLPFGWDNEFEETIVDVPAFTIDSLPVTNGEFFEFVQSEAYHDARYWLPQDWRWKQLENRWHPNCWVYDGHAWFYRTMFDLLPLDKVAGWPVYVCLAEARAYARWRGKRLPTEAEFHRAAFYGPDGRETCYPWGDTIPDHRHGNFDFNAWSPMPAGSHPAGTSRWGVSDLLGDGWELTDTPFAAFRGFKPYIDSYPDYSRDFFDGKHFVLKGASWATSAELLRPSFRNWYQARYPYVFAKFRCVSD